MKLRLSARKLLLMDGIGAVVTALLLSQVVARWEYLFGMPGEVVYILATIAGCYAMYSLVAFWLVKARWAFYLRIIALANILYCTATLSLVIRFQELLTGLGVSYFLIELLVVIGLALVELKASQKTV